MSNLNFALMGCGKIARKHGGILSGEHVAGARLCAVCDMVKDRATGFGKEHGVPGYGSLEEMVKAHPEVDVVTVLTPSGAHARDTVDVARLGKHVVVEKPMALNIDDADLMIEECDRAGVRLFVVKQNRYNRAVQALRRALDAGRLGKLVMGTVRVRWCRKQSYYDQDPWRGTWAHDGGVFCNQASHHIDLLEWMMGVPETVFARSATALADIEAEDTGAAIFRFRGGALGIVEATTATRPKDLEGSLSLLGEKGAVVIGGFAANRIETWAFEAMSEEDEQIVADANCPPPDVSGFGHIPFLNNVVDCIRNDSPALVDGLEGRRSLELITAIYESIETGREVTLRFRPEKCRLGLGADRVGER